MQFEAFSHPKARDLSLAADDVLLHIPGRVTAVFDGATDATGRKIGGVSVGRLAALAAAHATMSLPEEAQGWPAKRILNLLSSAIAQNVPMQGNKAPASTTAMIAFERPSDIRMVGIGDTGFRVNCGPMQVTELMPDRAAIPARVLLFEHLMSKGFDAEKSEEISRLYMGLGLDFAVQNDVISAQFCKDIILGAIKSARAPHAAVEIATFLRAGLQSQYSFSNSKDHPLSYGVLNGHVPNSDFNIDINLPRDKLTTLEIFSDGYLQAPKNAELSEWEEVHQRLELEDPHKLVVAPACKGSTKTNFFDDRTIVILTYQ